MWNNSRTRWFNDTTPPFSSGLGRACGGVRSGILPGPLRSSLPETFNIQVCCWCRKWFVMSLIQLRSRGTTGSQRVPFLLHSSASCNMKPQDGSKFQRITHRDFISSGDGGCAERKHKVDQLLCSLIGVLLLPPPSCGNWKLQPCSAELDPMKYNELPPLQQRQML